METLFLAPEECGQLSEMHNGDGFNIRYDQVEPGAFTGECLYRGSPHMVFCREQYTRSICVHGTAPKGMTTVVMSTRRNGAAWLNGEEMTSDSLGVFTPGDEGAYRSPANQSFTNFIISQERLERAVRALFQLPLSEVLKHTATLNVSAMAMDLLREATAEIFTPKSPDAILRAEVWDRKCEGSVLQALCVALVGESAGHERQRAYKDGRIAKRVRNYIEENLAKEIDMEMLCRVSGLHAAALEAAFQDYYGVEPMEFLCHRRLNAARHALASARVEENTVKTIASQHGFVHLGRFTEAYQGLFGESPSTTLKKR